MSALVRRLLVFVVTFSVLQITWQELRGSAFERLVVDQGTVRPAVALVNFLTPAVKAQAVGTTMRARGGGLNILNGCEGVEALFLLIAAFLAASLPWRRTLSGVALGTVVVFAVNQARILALFYAFRADRSLFDTLHGIVTPIAVILCVLAFFYAWIHRPTHPHPTSA
jgi:exosortase/archaeosortase family protein